MANCLDDIVRTEDASDAKFFSLQATKLLGILLRQKDRVIESQKKLIGISEDVDEEIERTLSLGNTYYKYSEKEDAYYCYRRAIRLFRQRKNDKKKKDDTLQIRRLYYAAKVFLTLKNGKQIEEKAHVNYLLLSALHEKSIDPAELLRACERNPRINFLLGSLLTATGKEEGVEYKKRALAYALEDGLDLEKLIEGKSEVVVFRDKLLGNEVIAKVGKLEDLEEEVSTTRQIISAVKDRTDCTTTTPIEILSVKDKHYYFMEREEGESFDDKIISGKATARHYQRIAEILGLIHAKILPKHKERDSREIIEQRLLEFGVNPELVYSITNNLQPALLSLEGIVRVYNKDAHPRNWKFDEIGRVIIIDNEAGREVPIVFEDANLLDQHEGLSYKEKIEIAKRHWESFNQHRGEETIKDHKKYELAYLNATIIRAFEVYTQVLRINRRNIATSTINSARVAIKIIQERFNEYYNEHKKNYAVLNDALTALNNG